jgi:indolepyruvate ferredoxin oxidoreductase, beta subunit
MTQNTTNVVFAGLGGQGVVSASDIFAETVFRAGFDVKKSELHGMSQRGGSVSSDVRFGDCVLSPMIPDGEADFLVVIEPNQVEVHQSRLKPQGQLILSSQIDESRLSNQKSLNVALLGLLSTYLPLTEECWEEALRTRLPEKLLELNLKAFRLGRHSHNSGNH